MADWIDETGGTVSNSDGRITLAVPAGAWTGRRQVTIEERPALGSIRVGDRRVDPVRHFALAATDEQDREDHGPFVRPVTLRFPLGSAELGRRIAPFASFYLWDDASAAWAEVPSTFDRTTLTLSADLPHFSDYLAGVGDDSNVLPTVDGFATDLNQGTASLSIPLKVPPGPHGFQPAMTLTYSSGGPLGALSEFHNTYEQMQASWVGLGFDLNLGYILIGSQRNYLTLNNRTYDLIYDTTKNDGTYYTQNDEFYWIRHVGYQDAGGTWWDYYLVRTKDGTEYRFGSDEPSGFVDGNYYTTSGTGSRQDGYWLQPNADNTQYTVHWSPVRYYLNQVTDTNGNQITLKYAALQGQRQVSGLTNASNPVLYDRWTYLSEIDYCSTDPGGPQRQLVFNRAAGRTDVPANISYTLDSSLDSIDEKVAGSLVRKYVFAYTTITYPAATYQTDNRPQGDLLLTSITECDGTATLGLAHGVASGKSRPPITFQYNTTSFFNGWVGDDGSAQKCPLPLLTQVNNGQGGSVAYHYTLGTVPSASGRFRDNGGNSGAQCQWWWVDTKTVADGQGNSYQTQYQHGTGTQAGPFGGWCTKLSGTNYPQWRGFNYTAETLPAGQVGETRFFRGGFSWSSATTVSRSDGWTAGDTECLKGLAYETRQFEPNTWGGFGTANGATVPTASEWTVWTYPTPTLYKPSNLSGSDTEDWNVYAVQKSSVQTNRNASYRYQSFVYETSYGNLTDIYDYDTSTSSWYRHTQRYYYPGNVTNLFNPPTSFSDQYVVDRLAREDVFDSRGTLQQQTFYCYDGTSTYTTQIGSGPYGWNGKYNNGQYGLLTMTRRWLNTTGQYVDTQDDYDQYGNRTSETRWNSYSNGTSYPSGDSRVTQTAYETTFNTFKQSVTNPKGQATRYQYDPKLGVLLSTTDPNSAQTTYQYDGFGRLVAVWAPIDDPTKLNAATALVSYQDAVLNPSTAVNKHPFRIQIGRRKDGGGTGFAKRAYEWHFYDGLGHLIQRQADFDRAQPIRAQDFNEVRGAISTDGGSPTPTAVTAGASVIKASDWVSLQGSVQTFWTTLGLGTLGWSSGMTPGGASQGTSKTPIYGSDLADLRFGLNLYETARVWALTNWANVPGNPAGNLTVANRFYDGRGLLSAESVPHLLAVKAPGLFASSDWNQAAHPQTTYQYDALKRTTARTQPDGTSTFQWQYSGFATTAIDENSHQKGTTTDAFGRTVKVQEYTGNSSNTYALLNTTSYGYDVADRLTTIIDQAGNQTTIAYDSLGRKTSLSDPDLGLGTKQWTYAYPPSPSSVNPLWLVSQQTDAKGQTLTYQYDVLDRVTSKSGPSLSVGYGYDSGTNGIGRRTSMSDNGGTASYSYDQRGRLTSLSRSINGVATPYLLSTTYDAMDRVTSLTYPNGDVLSYVYGDHGKPIACSLNGAPLVTSATYNALKKVSTLSLGNGLQTSWKYYGLDVLYSQANPAKWFGLPYQVQTSSLQNQSFPVSGPTGYDSIGNPLGILYSDHTSESFTFAYNELDQLLSMGGSASESYGTYTQSQGGTFDIGNLLAKGGAAIGYPNAGQPRPHAPLTVSSSVGSFGYDANGNRQSDLSGQTYSYDAENRLLAVLQSLNAVLQNTFDGDGSRLVRIAGGTTTHYVGDFNEVNPTTGVATCSYPFNGQPVALKQGSTLFYLHRDQVGSVVSISDANAKEVASLRYAPFGNLRSLSFANGYTALPTDRLFTGQTRDASDDRFYFFKARYYDATIGTFHTPDTVPPDPNFPLRLNHYAYADDNPLRFRDSSGHFSEIPDFLRSPSILINAPPSRQEQPTQPLINVAPPRLPSGPLIFTGQANVGITAVTIAAANVPTALVNVPSAVGSTVVAFEKRVDQVLSGLEKHNIPVDTDQTEHLNAQGARAGYLPSQGEAGTILVGENTTYSSLMHEVRHFGQDRDRGYPGSSTEDSRTADEIDAHEYELRNADRWNTPPEEVDEAQQWLQTYQDRYDELQAAKVDAQDEANGMDDAQNQTSEPSDTGEGS